MSLQSQIWEAIYKSAPQKWILKKQSTEDIKKKNIYT